MTIVHERKDSSSMPQESNEDISRNNSTSDLNSLTEWEVPVVVVVVMTRRGLKLYHNKDIDILLHQAMIYMCACSHNRHLL